MRPQEVKWSTLGIAVSVAIVDLVRFGITPTLLLLIAAGCTYVFGTITEQEHDD